MPGWPGVPLDTAVVGLPGAFSGATGFPAVAWFGRVDAGGLLEAAPSQRRDDDSVAALHPLHPAEIEVALGDRGPYGTRDVWASLGPIEAESAKVAMGRTQCGKLDPELGEKTVAAVIAPSATLTTLSPDAERLFRVSWEPIPAHDGARVRLRGYLENLYGERAARVQLLAQALDTDGDVVDHGLGFRSRSRALNR